jgi:hypothetical protein
MTDKKIVGSHWFKFHAMNSEGAKEHKRGLRHWLAWLVRGMADRIDGAESMTIETTSIPVIRMSERSAIINCGLAHAKNLFVESVRYEATEQAMREELPELYEAGK